MSSVKRILVATDLSDDARAAVRFATGLAKDLSAEVVLLHVIDPRTGYSLYLPENAEIRTHVEREMEDLLWEVKKHVRVRSIVVMGHAHAEIVKAAKAQEAGLIVIGSRGAGRVASALFGSTVSKVIHEAQCPVLVHHGVQEAARSVS